VIKQHGLIKGFIDGAAVAEMATKRLSQRTLLQQDTCSLSIGGKPMIAVKAGYAVPVRMKGTGGIWPIGQFAQAPARNAADDGHPELWRTVRGSLEGLVLLGGEMASLGLK
jgi:hypothetical protein